MNKSREGERDKETERKRMGDGRRRCRGGQKLIRTEPYCFFQRPAAGRAAKRQTKTLPSACCWPTVTPPKSSLHQPFKSMSESCHPGNSLQYCAACIYTSVMKEFHNHNYVRSVLTLSYRNLHVAFNKESCAAGMQLMLLICVVAFTKMTFRASALHKMMR